MPKQNEWTQLLIPLAFLFGIVGLSVYGYVYNKVDFEQISQIDLLLQLIPSSKTLIVLVMVILVARFFIGIVLQFYYYQRAKKDLRIKQIKLPNTISLKTKKVEDFIKDLYKRQRVWYKRLLFGREWFGLMVYVNKQNRIEFYILFPQDKASGVERTILDHFPGCELKTVQHKDLPVPQGKKELYGGHFYINKKGDRSGLPLHPFSESQLGSILTHMSPQTWIFLRFSPQKSHVLEKRARVGLRNLGMSKEELETIFKIEIDQPHKTTSDLTPTERARYKSLFQMYTGREKAFRVALSLWSEHPNAVGVVQDIKSSIERVMEFDNFIAFRIARLFRHWQNPLRPLHIIPWPWERMDWSHTELANLLHFPDAKDKIYQLPETGDRPYIETIQDEESQIEADDFSEGMFVGNLLDKQGNTSRSIRIPYSTWTYMSFGAGETGSGKTSLVLNMLYDHLDQVWYRDPDAPGATFIDPKGEDAYKLLAKINADLLRLEKEGVDTSELRERIHFFDVASDQYVLGLNLLHKNEWETNDDVVNNVLDLLKNAYQRESMLLDKFGQLALHALLLDDGQHSILGMEQLLRKDATFRNRILPKVKGTIYETDWKECKEELKKGQVTQPVLNRLQKIRLNTRMRRIFGHTNMGLHPAKWMDEGHIVIISCAGLSKAERKLVMGFIITQYHLQAQKRKRKSKIHLNICDEFHLIQIPIVKEIYAIDRYTGHCFMPMTQYADQIDDEILEAFDGNVSTYIACNQGSKSAKSFYEMSRKAIDADEIQRLEKLTAVISTKNRRGERVTFKVKTPPPYFFKPNGQPAYYGPEVDKERHEREHAAALTAARRFGEELMARDCETVDNVDQWIKEYLTPKTILQEAKKKGNEQGQETESDKMDLNNEALPAEKAEDLITTETDEYEQESDKEFFTPLY